MKVQKVRLSQSRHSYIVLGNDLLPIKPILSFIRYLDNIDKSIHTIRAYANHLKLYWEYLQQSQLEWALISLDGLSAFVGWLRTEPASSNIIHITDSTERKPSTINSILGCLASFYKYHNSMGNTEITLNASNASVANIYGNRYKAFVHSSYYLDFSNISQT